MTREREVRVPGGALIRGEDRRMRRSLRITAIALAVAILSVPAWPEGSARAGELVVVDRYRLNPATVTIPAGGMVTFRVDQDESTLDPMQPLTLVSDDGLFRSPPLEPGDRWGFVFERTGLHRYHIEQHPGVEGVIVVE